MARNYISDQSIHAISISKRLYCQHVARAVISPDCALQEEKLNILAGLLEVFRVAFSAGKLSELGLY